MSNKKEKDFFTYRDNLEAGLKYQDFITAEFYQRGIVLLNFLSQKYQNEKGENILGAEIKLDRNFHKTGNLYIETHEKRKVHNVNFVESGLLRDDSWLFIIGDESKAFIFATKHLKHIYNNKLCNIRFVEQKTSKGFLLPIKHAESYTIRTVNFKKGV